MLDETRHFYYSVGWQVLEERVDGTGSGDVERQFVWGLEYVDKLLVRYRDTTGNGTLDETLYVVCDTNYRITAIVSTAVRERYVYSPYGQRTVLNDDWSLHNDPTFGDFEFRYGHQGLRHDPASGLVSNRNRIYIPLLGRLGQPDPLNQNEPGGGYQDGMNLYQYVESNPVVFVDPFGLEVEVDWDFHSDVDNNQMSLFVLITGLDQCDCESVGLIQFVKFTSNLPGGSKDWQVDDGSVFKPGNIGKVDSAPFYNSPSPVSNAGHTTAALTDKPYNAGGGVFEFKVFAVCAKGSDEGEVYGHYGWGAIAVPISKWPFTGRISKFHDFGGDAGGSMPHDPFDPPSPEIPPWIIVKPPAMPGGPF